MKVDLQSNKNEDQMKTMIAHLRKTLDIIELGGGKKKLEAQK